VGTYDYLLLERCGAIDGWHQSSAEIGGFTYVVDHYNCNNPDTHHGDMCDNHPCLGCSANYCPEGSEKYGWGCDGETLVTTPEDIKQGKDETSEICLKNQVGNPVSVYNGNNYEEVEDIRFRSPFRQQLTFKRFYNSQAERPGPMGYGWSHNFQVSLTPPCLQIGNQCHLKIEEESGRGVYFKEGGDNIWQGAYGEDTRVVQTADGYEWRRTNGMLYHFALGGELQWIEDEVGNRLMLTYTDGRLQSISDQSSTRGLTLQYNSDDRIDHITGPVTPAVSDGIWVGYDYDGEGNLAAVSYADGSGFHYIYADPHDLHNLTEKKNR
jgi:hypothetical protein